MKPFKVSTPHASNCPRTYISMGYKHRYDHDDPPNLWYEFVCNSSRECKYTAHVLHDWLVGNIRMWEEEEEEEEEAKERKDELL